MNRPNTARHMQTQAESNSRSLGSSSNSINLISKQLLKVRLDNVNGADMEFIFKKRGQSAETHQLRMERNRNLKPDKLGIGKGRDHESLQGRKQIEKIDFSIISKQLSDGENQRSQIQHKKCPTSALKTFKKHKIVNLIRLKQTAKLNTKEAEQNEKTAEAIQKAEKNFALDTHVG